MNGNPDRLNKLTDLTHWNRAGLPRFEYVDGDAAVWLEELRIAMMGLAARGAEMEERLPETWRGRFSLDMDQWPEPAEREAFVEALVWKTLARAFPDRPETARRHNARLLNQYALNSGEYGWEIMRAAARASHVLLGHLNAYANEGYLRTATQWENLVRLSFMVNHQPAPPTSAVTTVGLIVDPTDDGKSVEIGRGLAMKYTPPEGGAPVLFETLSPLKVHPDLNATRVIGWNSDPDTLQKRDDWIDDPEADIAPGSVAVLFGSGASQAVSVMHAERNEETGVADITLDAAGPMPTRGSAILHLGPKAVTTAAPRSTDGVLVLRLDTASNYPINSIIRLQDAGLSGLDRHRRVLANTDGFLKLDFDGVPALGSGDVVTIESMVPVSDVGSGATASRDFGSIAYYADIDGVVHEAEGDPLYAEVGNGVQLFSIRAQDEIADDIVNRGIESVIIGYSYAEYVDAVGPLFSPVPGSKQERAAVVNAPPCVVPDIDAPERVVSFTGKPPKSLEVGSVYFRRARAGSDPELQGVEVLNAALVVAGVAVTADGYAIQFDGRVCTGMAVFKPDAHDFHGPMTRRLRPVDHDRNPTPAFDGPEIILTGIGQFARELIRLGKPCLVEDETGAVDPVRAVLVEAVEVETGGTGLLKLLFEPAEGLAGFRKGWTTLNLNAVECSHGETKSPKVLGSGDAEKAAQRFALGAREVSFVPSTVAETGVAPDMDISVDGVLWSYRDLIDPTADGTESYAVSMTEEGRLVVHFRRRLPTGTDNVVVSRYRTGVGPKGAVPAWSFAKPMKKHRYVRALTQPFAATGGADREPVGDLRVNAPARLAANGRAVSLKDFERLCRRRSDVWQAWARPVVQPGVRRRVAIVIVPANGGTIGPTLREVLTEFVEARALPGIRVDLEDYEAIRLIITAKIRIDIETFDKTEIQAAAQAVLITEFALKRRGLGQPAYISEVAAALERVEGVETATVPGFAVQPTTAIRRTAMSGGAPSAFFPFENQVIFAAPKTAGADMTVQVEPI
ncbi:hypothetical protein KG088_17500 [Halomonas sp. TRM85114]|uniref:hypothetical protein n=1 Tax=Halomonas jincaotanensis TaxID=2810616 RepID=UPI001BD59D20|nr:hypothetical protein [Halomonas jincaotanensis]MBS9405406.1 hypothetical protein [Halomonas jincaotanensis]